jgi:hypothetical protein
MSAAGVDAVFGFELEEVREEVVDGNGGFEFGEVGGKGGGEIGRCVLMLGVAGMVAAEEGFRIWNKRQRVPLTK